jgi:hypothetical protein
MGERRGVNRVFVGKPERKSPLVRPRRWWDDNIKMDLQVVGLGLWTGLIWLRIRTLAGSCGCGNEPLISIKCGEFLE